MSTTLREATVQRHHHGSHDALRGHLAPFVDADNDPLRPELLNGLTLCGFIGRSLGAEPHQVAAKPHHGMPAQQIPVLREDARARVAMQ